MDTSDRELTRHWREWANDTGSHVVNAAELIAQGIGAHAPDMRKPRQTPRKVVNARAWARRRAKLQQRQVLAALTGGPAVVDRRVSAEGFAGKVSGQGFGRNGA